MSSPAAVNTTGSVLTNNDTSTNSAENYASASGNFDFESTTSLFEEQSSIEVLHKNLGIAPEIAVPIFIVFIVFYTIAYVGVVAFISYKTDWKEPMDFGTRSRMLKMKNAQMSQKRKSAKEKALDEAEVAKDLQSNIGQENKKETEKLGHEKKNRSILTNSSKAAAHYTNDYQVCIAAIAACINTVIMISSNEEDQTESSDANNTV